MIYNNVAEIYDAIEKIRAKLLATTADLSEEQLNARENGEGWSIAEIIEHVGMVESGVVKMAEKSLPKAESEGVKSDGTFNPPISFFEIASEATGKKFEAPPHVHPQGALDLNKLLSILEGNRNTLNVLRPRIEAVDLSNATFPHPYFGPLNLYQWLVMVGLHEYRHTTQIERILTDT